MEESNGSSNSSIVFYPSPGRSHLDPLVELCKHLIKQQSSISIIILTSCLPHETESLQIYTSKVASTNPSIKFIHLQPSPPPPPPPPLLTEENENEVGWRPPSSSVLDIVTLFFELPKLNNPTLHQTLTRLSETSNIKALIIDFFCSFASQVSFDLGIPTYYFGTQGAFAMSAFLYVPIVDKIFPNNLKDLDVLVEFPGSPPIPSKEIATVHQDKSHRVYWYFVEAGIQMAKSKGIIANTFEEFEPSSLAAIREGRCTPWIEVNKVPPVYCVGPLVTSNYITTGRGGDDGQEECLTWLDSQPSGSVLFLCFGRMGVFPSKQLKEMATGLERSGVRFLWVVRNPLDLNATTQPIIGLDTLFPQGFLDRTKDRGFVVKDWAPQYAVLNHRAIGGFLTHCGWSTVLEAVCAGVPMLAWPLYAEQKMNRVYLVEGVGMALGIHEDLEGFVSAAELEERVTQLMCSEAGNSLRQRVGFMKVGARKARGDGGSSRVALANLVDSFMN